MLNPGRKQLKLCRRFCSVSAKRAAAAQTMVHLHRYPIDRIHDAEGARFVELCRTKLQTEGILVLHEFLNPDAVEAFLAEESQLHGSGGTSHVQYDHSVEFNSDLAPGKELADLDPHRILRAEQRVLGYHQFAKSSCIRALFHWQPILDFVSAVMGHELFLSADMMNRLHSQRYLPGDTLGWHHDKSEFFFNIMMQPAAQGGVFEYVHGSAGKDDLVDRTLRGDRDQVHSVNIQSGTVVIFRGKENMHQVTPIEKGDRISVIFNFASEEGGGILDEETRQLFFGSQC